MAKHPIVFILSNNIINHMGCYTEIDGRMLCHINLASFPGHSHLQYLIACSTASNQILEVGTAWERDQYELKFM